MSRNKPAVKKISILSPASSRSSSRRKNFLSQHYGVKTSTRNEKSSSVKRYQVNYNFKSDKSVLGRLPPKLLKSTFSAPKNNKRIVNSEMNDSDFGSFVGDKRSIPSVHKSEQSRPHKKERRSKAVR